MRSPQAAEAYITRCFARVLHDDRQGFKMQDRVLNSRDEDCPVLHSFEDTSGDGVGDLAGIAENLDHLSDTLGVDAAWISPFYPSSMRDFGYDIADFTAVDPLFGALEDFDELIEEAHRRGLRIIVDYVTNHTAEVHPWFVESRSSRDNPKRDWYIWRDPKPDGSLPNDWVEETGGSVWEFDEKTGQYYLHSHYASQPFLYDFGKPVIMYGFVRWKREKPRLDERLPKIVTLVGTARETQQSASPRRRLPPDRRPRWPGERPRARRSP